ncbi:MAG: PD-(D/E)XK nuclease family protein [Bacteriovoracaceae bacterium]|nr:PD-(D/E)XK nuclease family protein [Bacteriovoracaceae bacterium]
MLKLLLFNQIEEIYQSQNSTSPLLCEDNSDLTTYVTPDAATADQLRSFFLQKGKSFAVQTWANLRGELARELELEMEILQKKDIYRFLYLYLRNLGVTHYSTFERFFEIYTELRSLDLPIEIIEKIAQIEFGATKENDSILASALVNLLQSYQILDEHHFYKELTQQLLKQKINKSTTYAFFGFQIFSALQLEYLRSLSTHVEVDIYLPKFIWEKSQSFDWPKWGSWNEVRDISKINAPSGEKKIKCKIHYVEISLWHQILNHQAVTNELVDFVLLDFSILKNVWNSFFRLDLNKFQIEQSYGLYQDIIEGLFQWIEKLPRQVKYDYLGLTNLIDQKVEIETKRTKTHFLKMEILKKMQSELLWLYESLLKANQANQGNQGNHDLSGDLQSIDFQFLKHLLLLSETRMKLSAVSKNKISVKWMGQIFESQKKMMIFLSKNFLSSGMDSIPLLDFESQKLITNVAPYPSKSWKNYFFMHQLEVIKQNSHSTIFVEHEALEQNKNLVEMLGEETDKWTMGPISLDQESKRDHNLVLGDLMKEKIQEELKSIPRNHSPSAHQMYLDCPRKYYLDRLDKILPIIQVDEDVTAREKGIFLDHYLAKEYLQILQRPINPDFWKSELEIFFKNKKLSRQRRSLLLEELLEQMGEIKKFLESLQLYIAHSFWKFKTKFQTSLQHFEIDFLAHDTEKARIFIIDLKRSAFSVPSMEETIQLSHVQIPYYLWHMSMLHPEILNPQMEVSILYLCANDVAQSAGISWNSSWSDHYSLFHPKATLKKFQKLDEGIESYLKRVALRFESIKWEIEKDQNFHPTPSDLKVCEYCHYNYVCFKQDKIKQTQDAIL